MRLNGNEVFRLAVPACHEGARTVEALIRDGVLSVDGQPEFALEVESCGRIPTLDDFISMFNEVMYRRFRGTEKNERQFKARIKEKYTLEEMHKAAVVAKKDPFHVEKRFKYLTPEYMLRSDILERYLNIEHEPDSKRMFDDEGV